VSDNSALDDIFTAIIVERQHQDEKWGAQNHESHVWLAILLEEVGEVAKALLEKDFLGIIHEIIQVAAVCVAWLECLTRNKEELDAS
jgi:NTP pyrophosphatase (non-canonical NTP hydrolase)